MNYEFTTRSSISTRLRELRPVQRRPLLLSPASPFENVTRRLSPSLRFVFSIIERASSPRAVARRNFIPYVISVTNDLHPRASKLRQHPDKEAARRGDEVCAPRARQGDASNNRRVYFSPDERPHS